MLGFVQQRVVLPRNSSDTLLLLNFFPRKPLVSFASVQVTVKLRLHRQLDAHRTGFSRTL